MDLKKCSNTVEAVLGHFVRHVAFPSLIILCMTVAGCGTRRPIVVFDVDPSNPCVNQLVHFIDRSTDPDGLTDLISWEWRFGDGGTASGPEVWHQYRSINVDEEGNEQEWIVKLTVTDTQGNRGVWTQPVEMKPTTTQLVGYYMQSAGTCCNDIEQTRPEIPGGCTLPFHQEDVLTGWWLAPTHAHFYLLAKLHYARPEVDRVSCLWTLYFRGLRGDDPPEFVKQLGQEERAVQHNHPYCVGFPLEISPEEEMPQPGWYQVFAEVSSPNGVYRNFIDFMLCVGGLEPL